MQYLCTSCKYQTVNRKCYFQHLQQKHSDENKKEDQLNHKEIFTNYKCSLCDYFTNKKQLFKKHQTVHLSIKLWKCIQCKYQTNRKWSLDLHVKSIHANFRHHCDLCSYTTTRKNYLKEHVKFIHNNKK